LIGHILAPYDNGIKLAERSYSSEKHQLEMKSVKLIFPGLIEIITYNGQFYPWKSGKFCLYTKNEVK